MTPFAYHQPTSIEAAIAALTSEASSRPLAGGTDLLTLMKAGISSPRTLIDIKRLPELDDRIVVSGSETTIGALATLHEIERDPMLRESYPALCQAAGDAASPQLRNMATLGGNVLQRPRCWYFRNRDVTCWLKGGDECQAADGENSHHAIYRESPCVAVHPSDPASALMLYGAHVTIRSHDGERQVAIDDFFTVPTADHRRENVLEQGKLITGFRLPETPDGQNSVYLKAMDRKVWAFALVGVAASVTVRDGRIADAQAVLTGVAPIPHRLDGLADALRGKDPSADVFTDAAQRSLSRAEPLSQNAYKLPLATSLLARALQQASQPEVVTGPAR